MHEASYIRSIAAWVFAGHSLSKNSRQSVSGQSVLRQVSKLSTSVRDSAEHECQHTSVQNLRTNRQVSVDAKATALKSLNEADLRLERPQHAGRCWLRNEVCKLGAQANQVAVHQTRQADRLGAWANLSFDELAYRGGDGDWRRRWCRRRKHRRPGGPRRRWPVATTKHKDLVVRAR